MKQLVCQATAMENEIKALIEDDWYSKNLVKL